MCRLHTARAPLERPAWPDKHGSGNVRVSLARRSRAARVRLKRGLRGARPPHGPCSPTARGRPRAARAPLARNSGARALLGRRSAIRTRHSGSAGSPFGRRLGAPRAPLVRRSREARATLSRRSYAARAPPRCRSRAALPLGRRPGSTPTCNSGVKSIRCVPRSPPVCVLGGRPEKGSAKGQRQWQRAPPEVRRDRVAQNAAGIVHADRIWTDIGGTGTIRHGGVLPLCGPRVGPGFVSCFDFWH